MSPGAQQPAPVTLAGSDPGQQPHLSCLDPAFTSVNDDGSIEGPTAEATLADQGSGITGLTVEGRHGSIADDMLGLQQLLTKVSAAIDPGSLSEIQAWVEDHLDGLPHSVYIGTRQVTPYVAPNSMFGDSATLVVTDERPDLGAPSSQGQGPG